MITVKDNEITGVMSTAYDEKLIDVVLYLEHLYPNRVVITCGYRPGDKGVHGQDPCRGLDIRSWTFSKPKRVVQDINKQFQYDPTRPEKEVAILHDVGQGEHIHLQTHPNTIRRQREEESKG